MSEHRSHRPAVMGMRGMVATAHPLASAAGPRLDFQLPIWLYPGVFPTGGDQTPARR